MTPPYHPWSDNRMKIQLKPPYSPTVLTHEGTEHEILDWLHEYFPGVDPELSLDFVIKSLTKARYSVKLTDVRSFDVDPKLPELTDLTPIEYDPEVPYEDPWRRHGV